LLLEQADHRRRGAAGEIGYGIVNRFDDVQHRYLGLERPAELDRVVERGLRMGGEVDRDQNAFDPHGSSFGLRWWGELLSGIERIVSHAIAARTICTVYLAARRSRASIRFRLWCKQRPKSARISASYALRCCASGCVSSGK